MRGAKGGIILRWTARSRVLEATKIDGKQKGHVWDKEECRFLRITNDTVEGTYDLSKPGRFWRIMPGYESYMSINSAIKVLECKISKFIPSKEQITGIKEDIKTGANVDDQDSTGSTSLMSAACKGTLEAVKLLIEKGADVNFADKEGYTALMAAVGGKNVGVIRLLAEKGADVNAMDKKGLTALSLAEAHKQDAMAQYLKENGAK